MPSYTSHSVVLGTSGADVVMSANSSALSLNNEIVTDSSGADVILAASIGMQKPVLNFTTDSIGVFLSSISTSGSCLTSTGALQSVTQYLQKKTTCPGDTIPSNGHASRIITDGFVQPLELTSTRGETATIGCDVNALSDGTNAPVTFDDEAILPTGVDTSQYVLGAVRAGNVVFGDLRSVNAAFGITLGEIVLGLASVWPEDIPILSIDPRWTITGRDVRKVGSGAVPAVGQEATQANTEIWYRKRKNKSTLEDVTAPVHIKVMISGLLYCTQSGEGSGRSDGSTTFEVQSVWDGTNNPMTVQTGIAYNPGF